MQKLQALVNHLIAAKVAKPEQINGVLESGEPKASFNEAGPDLLLFRHDYVGRVVFEKLPRDVAHAIACTLAWLEENGGEYDELLGWVGEPIDDKLGDVDLRVQFSEERRYIPKPGGYTGHGIVTWRGVQYVPGEDIANVATGVELEGVTS